MKAKEKAKTAEEFDRRFDAGEDIFDIADPVSVTRPGLEIKRLNLLFNFFSVTGQTHHSA